MPNSDHTPAGPDLEARIAKMFADADAKEAALVKKMSEKYGTARRATDDRGLDR